MDGMIRFPHRSTPIASTALAVRRVSVLGLDMAQQHAMRRQFCLARPLQVMDKTFIAARRNRPRSDASKQLTELQLGRRGGESSTATSRMEAGLDHNLWPG